jgi:anti-sigma factor ChrR (cupin superfamily)
LQTTEAIMRTWKLAVACAAAAALAGSAAAAEKSKDGMKGKPKADKVIPAGETEWKPLDPKSPDGPQLAVLWGSAEKAPYGFLLRVKAGTEFPRHSHTHDYDAVVIEGEWRHTYGDEADAPVVPAGSHWHQPGKQVHGDACASTSGECIILVSYPRGKRDFIPAKEGKAKGK